MVSRMLRKPAFCIGKTKAQISEAVAADQRLFNFATQIQYVAKSIRRSMTSPLKTVYFQFFL